jgi:hypothetical protein
VNERSEISSRLIYIDIPLESLSRLTDHILPTMFLLRYGFVLFASLFSTILAAPAPVTNTTATADATPAILTPIGPIRGPISLDVTVLSFNYYEDFECSTLLGNMNISSLDLADNKCFALPGNSLVFTYQLHDGTLSYYNPDEVNSKFLNEVNLRGTRGLMTRSASLCVKGLLSTAHWGDDQWVHGWDWGVLYNEHNSEFSGCLGGGLGG